jgi:hypothetical protein
MESAEGKAKFSAQRFASLDPVAENNLLFKNQR